MNTFKKIILIIVSCISSQTYGFWDLNVKNPYAIAASGSLACLIAGSYAQFKMAQNPAVKKAVKDRKILLELYNKIAPWYAVDERKINAIDNEFVNPQKKAEIISKIRAYNEAIDNKSEIEISDISRKLQMNLDQAIHFANKRLKYHNAAAMLKTCGKFGLAATALALFHKHIGIETVYSPLDYISTIFMRLINPLQKYLETYYE